MIISIRKDINWKVTFKIAGVVGDFSVFGIFGVGQLFFFPDLFAF